MAQIEKRLEELGIVLPPAPSPMANYVSVQRSGNMLYFSGSGPMEGKTAIYQGRLGENLTVEEGYQAARISGLNLIAQLKRVVGDLDKVKQIVKVLAFVASAPDFYAQPAVMNGASDLFVEVFGEKGKHARSAVGTSVLPFGIPVEIEMIVEIEE
ncbi:MAG: RidA family protein [Lachnospiraceae bacterium]|nr:RidA family protein [Lachnospiraceae bacterium]